jgi:class 3 adenylate cyclase
VKYDAVPICSNCGADNPDHARFCLACATPLTAAAAERRKLVTSVFCDLSGSTALAEQADEEAVFEIMRSYFDAARAALERHGGTVEKFIGDAVVGMFGVPEAHEDDALRACRAALEIQVRIDEVNAGLLERFGARVAVRIGVNTGEVVAGDAAKREMFAAANTVVLGDAVNVAARLEQAAAPGEVLVGEATYRLVRDAVAVSPVPEIDAKGKSEPLVAYRLERATAQGPLPRREAGPLVGRIEELAVIEAEFEAVVAERRCRAVTVVGDAGVGKSRLVAEALLRIGDGARPVHGACLSYGEGITFWAVAQIVRDLAGIDEDDSVDEARERLPETLARLLGLAEGSITAAETIDAIAGFLAENAWERPLIVVVEDIHWAEPTLLDLLVRLPELIEAPVLVLCTARPELVEGRPDWPLSVRLEPLDPSDGGTLLDSLNAPPEARARLAQAAAGNPLYAEELVAWIEEGGDLDELPTSLNALLGARLDRLSSDERDTLERGAIEGEIFHQGAVSELSEKPSVEHELGELTRKDLIRIAAASFAGELVAYRFKHTLVRDAAYRATTKRLRAALHERFADWLERRAGGRVVEYHEVIGYHLEQAYGYLTELGPADDHARKVAQRAAGHLGPAGRRAVDHGDYYAAANLLTRAATLLPADSRERLELLHPRVNAVSQTQGGSDAIDAGRELTELAEKLGDRRLAAHGRLFTAPVPYMNPADDPAEARAILEDCVAVFEATGDLGGLAMAGRRLAMVHAAEGNLARAVEELERGLDRARRAGDPVAYRTVGQSLAFNVVNGPIPANEAIERCREIGEGAPDDRILNAVIARCLALLEAMAGRLEVARELELGAAPVLEHAGFVAATTGSLAISAYAKELYGDRAGAEHDQREKWLGYRDQLRGIPHRLAIDPAYRLAGLYCDDGRWDAAEQQMAEYRDAPVPAGGTGALGFAVAARLAANAGNHTQSETLARRAVAIAGRIDELNTSGLVWTWAAEVEAAAGRDPAAALTRAVALYEAKGNVTAARRLPART